MAAGRAAYRSSYFPLDIPPLQHLALDQLRLRMVLVEPLADDLEVARVGAEEEVGDGADEGDRA